MPATLKGFTLLELMIVVAIIGILSSVALPAYQNYSARAKISETMLALSTCRSTISETIQAAVTLPVGGDWLCESQTGTILSTYVESIETSDEGAIRARIRNVNSLLDGQYIMMRPWPDIARSNPVQLGDAIAVWDCGPSPTNTSDIINTLPGTCRASPAQLGTTSGWAGA